MAKKICGASEKGWEKWEIFCASQFYILELKSIFECICNLVQTSRALWNHHSWKIHLNDFIRTIIFVLLNCTALDYSLLLFATIHVFSHSSMGIPFIGVLSSLSSIRIYQKSSTFFYSQGVEFWYHQNIFKQHDIKIFALLRRFWAPKHVPIWYTLYTYNWWIIWRRISGRICQRNNSREDLNLTLLNDVRYDMK